MVHHYLLEIFSVVLTVELIVFHDQLDDAIISLDTIYNLSEVSLQLIV